ncbi:MAG: tetratricopeptide repeat protein, partial [Candidatus Desulforudis sp.]|nr:tetratricopeptide repeat protein [Desulforudis sp.]
RRPGTVIDLTGGTKVMVEALGAGRLHIDAYNHLAVLAWRDGGFKRAEKLYQQAFSIGRQVLPDNFKGRLTWTLFYNRPFLRAVHGLALFRVQNGNVSEAGRLLNRLLQFDPKDPLGAREILRNL